MAKLRHKAHSSKFFARPQRSVFFALAQLVEQRLGVGKLARLDAVFQQLQNDRRVACGIGRRGGTLHPAQKPLRGGERGNVLEQRSKTPAGSADIMQMLFVRLADEAPARTLQRAPLVPDDLYQPLHRSGTLMRGGVRRGYFSRPPRTKTSDVRSTRFPILVVLLLVVAAATWYYVSQRAGRGGETIAIHFTKLDGKTLGDVRVSLRPRQPGESAAEHLHNTVLYAAVQAVAGPPNDVQAIRFPPGTRVIGVSVDGSTATVDLSKEVEAQAGGTFGENGEFKGLVYTVTGIPGIDAVQITVDGSSLETLPGGHLELDQPLHRSDW